MTTSLIVDSFAGGGGASLGIHLALGRGPDIAINHDAEAIAMHTVNHPTSRHYCEDVWKVDPVKACGGRKVSLAWFSPDCKHFSKAKGGKPVEKKIRGLAWVAIRWAKAVRPDVIALENVEEFQDWGPLLEDNTPCPLRKGLTFRRWVAQLKTLGYQVELRQLRACDFGTPTIRKRLFVIARCDGLPIVWPAPTHGAGLRPFRTAAECIDWSIPCCSIFERKKPLAEKTMRRIARGIMKYVVEAADPFIVPLTHQGDVRTHDINQPMPTVTGAHRGELALIAPVLAGVGGRMGQSPERPVDRPYHTVTAKADTVLVAPVMVRTAHGDVDRHGHRRGRGDHDPAAPLPTVTASPDFALVGATLVGIDNKSNGTSDAWDPKEPLRTVTSENRFAVAAATLIQTGYGERPGQTPRALDINAPLGTVVGGGAKHALVTAFLSTYYGQSVGSEAESPLQTVASENKHGVVALQLGLPFQSKAPKNHTDEVRAFLLKWYGTAVGQDVRDPMHTSTAKARFGVVTVRGEDYVIVDIGLRMLTPRELFRAQGFPDSYQIEKDATGKRLTKTAQVRMAGNSVCPPVAEAIIRANVSLSEDRLSVGAA